MSLISRYSHSTIAMLGTWNDATGIAKVIGEIAPGRTTNDIWTKSCSPPVV